jgi:hypothetical protein
MKTENYNDLNGVDVNNMTDEQVVVIERIIDAIVNNSSELDSEVREWVYTNFSENIEKRLITHVIKNNNYMRERVAWIPTLPNAVYDLFEEFLIQYPESPEIILPLARNTNTPIKLLRFISESQFVKTSPVIMSIILLNEKSTWDIIQMFESVKSDDIFMKHCIERAKARCPDTPSEFFETIVDSPHFTILHSAMNNPKCPFNLIDKIRENHDIIRKKFDETCVSFIGKTIEI